MKWDIKFLPANLDEAILIREAVKFYEKCQAEKIDPVEALEELKTEHAEVLSQLSAAQAIDESARKQLEEQKRINDDLAYRVNQAIADAERLTKDHKDLVKKSDQLVKKIQKAEVLMPVERAGLTPDELEVTIEAIACREAGDLDEHESAPHTPEKYLELLTSAKTRFINLREKKP